MKHFEKELRVTTSGPNYTAIDLGKLDNLQDYYMIHPKLNHRIQGKVFLGELLESTGMEMSVQLLPPLTEIPFVHKHTLHEEIYIFIKGSGEFQVDGNVFNINEGSIIRVSPEGSRSWKNTSEESMVFIVVQASANSLSCHGIADGFRVDEEKKQR